MDKILTIAIPTYNRKHQLIRLLKSIECQNCTDDCKILISDNCSNYSVVDAINQEFSGALRDSIEVMKREINGGGDYNISSLFAYCKTSLFWIVGDDDELLSGSILKVIENYKKYPEIPFFKYAMPAAFKFTNDIRLSCVDDFVSCHKKGYLLGGIIFISNNVYNVELIKPYFTDCLYYGYSSISQIIPMMHCLVDSDFDVLLCKDYIVKYNAPDDDHWNYLKVVTSLSTILDINWGNKHKEITKIFRVICDYFGFGNFLLDNIKISDKSYRKYIYWKGKNTVFKHRKNLLELFALFCYWLERWFHISFLSGFYLTLLNKQTQIQNNFRKIAAKNARAAKLFYFLKKHLPLLR